MKNEIKKKLKTPQATKVKAGALVIPDKKKETKFIIAALSGYVIIGLIGVFHHEMWRDELQTWLVGASSKTLGDFMSIMRGQPLLWYLFNFILSRFTDAPLISRIFHFLFSVASVYLILKYAPFSRLQKILLSFSYFVFYEYSLIARGYALTVFFLFLFCALYQMKSKNRYLILSLFLVGLANGTGAEGIVLTLSLLGMMVIDYYLSVDTSIRKKYNPLQLYTGVAIALIGVYIALWFISPPSAGTDRSDTWFLSFNMDRLTIALRTFWMSFIPIPNLSTINTWNSNYFFQRTTSPFTFHVLFILSLFIFIYCILLYSKKISVAAFYLAATCVILLFCYANNVIFALLAVRHYGFIFIAFVAAAWLAPKLQKTKWSIPGLPSLSNKWRIEKNFTYLLTGLLAINTLGGAIAYCKDYSLNFSNIETTGDYIMSHNLGKMPETGLIGYAVAAIPAYTKQPIYLLDNDFTGMYDTWDVTRLSYDNNVTLSRLANFISKQHDSVLFISTGDYYGIGEGKVIGNVLFTRITSFYGSIVSDENFVLYIAKKFDIDKQLQSTAAWTPAMVTTILNSAYDLIQKNKLDEAEKILTKVQEKTQGMAIPHLHNYFGILYSKKNMTAEAEKEFNTEIAMNLEKEEAFFNLGMLCFQNKNYEKAIQSWDSTIAINPKNADALNNLGVCYLNFKGDNNQAKIFFEKALELNPNYTQGYYNLLACAQNSHDEEALIKYIRILLDKGTSINDIKAKGINISDELLNKVNAR